MSAPCGAPGGSNHNEDEDEDDAGEEVWEEMDGRPLTLFTDERIGERFRSIDATQIRARRMSRAIAPTKEEQPEEEGWTYRRGEDAAAGGRRRREVRVRGDGRRREEMREGV